MKIREVDLGGPVRYADFGGRGPVCVLVHGLGGASLNWMGVGPLLARRARVLAPDLPGFGSTPPAGRPASIQANARFLDRFVTEVSGAPAILVGASMGGTVAILEAAAHPEHVAGLVLVDPALPMAGTPDRLVLVAFAAYAVPGLGERFLRYRLRTLGPEGMLRQALEFCCAEPSAVGPEVLAAHREFAHQRAGQPWAAGAFLEATRSLVPLVVRRNALRSVIRQAGAPTLLVHGDGDRLVSVVSARAAARMRPDWTFRELPGVGHLPMLEAPERLAGLLTEWLDGPGRHAVAAARRRRVAPAASPASGGPRLAPAAS